MIKQHYVVTKDTCVLLPAKQMEFGTIVIEGEEALHVDQTPLEIIKKSCDRYWSTYDGRRTAVVDRLRYRQKTPIPVSIEHKLCFFPTHSPIHIDNCWINWLQIDVLREIKKKDRTNNEQVEIIFKNGYRLGFDISWHTMHQQNDRAFAVMYQSGMVP